jgi:hypothetical protein
MWTYLSWLVLLWSMVFSSFLPSKSFLTLLGYLAQIPPLAQTLGLSQETIQAQAAIAKAKAAKEKAKEKEKEELEEKAESPNPTPPPTPRKSRSKVPVINSN